MTEESTKEKKTRALAELEELDKEMPAAQLGADSLTEAERVDMMEQIAKLQQQLAQRDQRLADTQQELAECLADNAELHSELVMTRQSLNEELQNPVELHSNMIAALEDLSNTLESKDSQLRQLEATRRKRRAREAQEMPECEEATNGSADNTSPMGDNAETNTAPEEEEQEGALQPDALSVLTCIDELETMVVVPAAGSPPGPPATSTPKSSPGTVKMCMYAHAYVNMCVRMCVCACVNINVCLSTPTWPPGTATLRRQRSLAQVLHIHTWTMDHGPRTHTSISAQWPQELSPILASLEQDTEPQQAVCPSHTWPCTLHDHARAHAQHALPLPCPCGICKHTPTACLRSTCHAAPQQVHAQLGCDSEEKLLELSSAGMFSRLGGLFSVLDLTMQVLATIL